MKTNLNAFNLFLFVCLLAGCSSSGDGYIEVDGLAPVIVLERSSIKTELERDFYIKGKITDSDGLKSVHLKNEEIYLNKEINLFKDSLITSFDLNYLFKVDKEVLGDAFEITVVATDLGNRSTEAILKVTMDGDFKAPTFSLAPESSLTVLIKAETRLNLKFSVQDDKSLKEVLVEIPEIDYFKSYKTFTDSNKSFEFSETIYLPSLPATYSLVITAIDKADLVNIKESVIAVSEMPDFQKMYLADVETSMALNSDIVGIPMLIERINPFTYKARYYSAKANSEVRFIPQKTDFDPICFGIDPDDNNLLNDNPDESLPIILPNKGYYEIVFNINESTYSIKEYKPTDKPIAIGSPMYLDGPSSETIPLEIGLVGAGIPNSGNWSTSDPLILTQDSTNPYLFSAEMILKKGDEIEFIISAKHTWGWWPEPFWRWDKSDDPEKNVLNGGENPTKWEIKADGKYYFQFDTHLNRSKFYPIKY